MAFLSAAKASAHDSPVYAGFPEVENALEKLDTKAFASFPACGWIQLADPGSLASSCKPLRSS